MYYSNKNSKLKNITLILIFLITLGMLLFGYINYTNSRFDIESIEITNISSNSATIVWTTDREVPGYVYLSTNENEDWTPIISNILNEKSFDDRDVEQNQAGDYVQISDISRFTHHVTLRDLDPNQDYHFRVGNLFHSIKHNETNEFTTFAVNNELNTPIPVYSEVINDQGIEFREGIVKYTLVADEFGNMLISNTYSALLSDQSTWAGDISSLKNNLGELIENPDQDRFLRIEVFTDLGERNITYSLNQNYQPLPQINIFRETEDLTQNTNNIYFANKTNLNNQLDFFKFDLDISLTPMNNDLINDIGATNSCQGDCRKPGTAFRSARGPYSYSPNTISYRYNVEGGSGNVCCAAESSQAYRCTSSGWQRDDSNNSRCGSGTTTSTPPANNNSGTTCRGDCRKPGTPFRNATGPYNYNSNNSNYTYNREGGSGSVCCAAESAQAYRCSSSGWQRDNSNNSRCDFRTSTPNPTTPPSNNNNNSNVTCRGFCRSAGTSYRSISSSDLRDYAVGTGQSDVCCGADISKAFICGANGQFIENPTKNAQCIPPQAAPTAPATGQVHSCHGGYCRQPGQAYVDLAANPGLKRTYTSDEQIFSSSVCCGANETTTYICSANGWRNNGSNPICQDYPGGNPNPTTPVATPRPVAPTLAPTALPQEPQLCDRQNKGTVLDGYNLLPVRGNNTLNYETFDSYITQGYSIAHPAIDVGSNAGRDILAIEDGQVAAVRRTLNESCTSSVNTLSQFEVPRWCQQGVQVIIQHADSYTVYSHLVENSPTVSVNDYVCAGQKIGEMGNTGNSSATHLHFEIRNLGYAGPPREDGNSGGNYQGNAFNAQNYFISNIQVPAESVDQTNNNDDNKLLNNIIRKYDAQNNQTQRLQPGVYNLTSQVDNYVIPINKVVVPEEYESGVDIIIFEDLNGDRIRQSNEPIIENDIINLDISRESEVFTYRFDEGWNTVSFPFIPDDFTTAEGLLDYLRGYGVVATNISKFEGGKFVPFIKREDNTTYKSDYNLIPGEGYFLEVITARANNVINISGKKIESSIPLQLNQGWNLVNIYNPNQQYTGESIIDTCIANSITCDTIANYDDGLYTDILVKEEGILFGNDFNLLDRRGYFLRVKEGGGNTLTP